MKLNVLGCYGGDLKGRFPAFLINDRCLLDAGTIGFALSFEAQLSIRSIALTHSHVDHLIGIPFFLDAVYSRIENPVEIMGLPKVLEDLKTHLINDILWPDFTRLPSLESPTLTYRSLTLNAEVTTCDALQITPIASCHTDSSCGYIVSDGTTYIVYTGDTGPCPAFWQAICQYKKDHPRLVLAALLVECSFPNRLEEFAVATGHLTADLLVEELDLCHLKDTRVLIFHMKPQFMPEIEAELIRVPDCRIELMKPDQEYHF